MRTATIKRIPNLTSGSKGPDTLYVVELYKDDEYVGIIDTTEHSIHYANDVVENWKTGILTESNEHIIRGKQ